MIIKQDLKKNIGNWCVKAKKDVGKGSLKLKKENVLRAGFTFSTTLWMLRDRSDMPDFLVLQSDRNDHSKVVRFYSLISLYLQELSM